MSWLRRHRKTIGGWLALALITTGTAHYSIPAALIVAGVLLLTDQVLDGRQLDKLNNNKESKK